MGLVFPWLLAQTYHDKCESWDALASYWYALYISSVLLDDLQDDGNGDVGVFTNVLLLYNFAVSGLTRHLTAKETEFFSA